ncbi:MAG TPA: hypothetical protein DD638_06535 [Pasteurellaceae bacterium]|nr:hypothetical protein [Pasteurellaceae bacterium]
MGYRTNALKAVPEKSRKGELYKRAVKIYDILTALFVFQLLKLFMLIVKIMILHNNRSSGNLYSKADV